MHDTAGEVAGGRAQLERPRIRQEGATPIQRHLRGAQLLVQQPAVEQHFVPTTGARDHAETRRQRARRTGKCQTYGQARIRASTTEAHPRARFAADQVADVTVKSESGPLIDESSINCLFGWETVKDSILPIIFRENERLVPVRIVELKVSGFER